VQRIDLEHLAFEVAPDFKSQRILSEIQQHRIYQHLAL
jgi:hypothetical protein